MTVPLSFIFAVVASCGVFLHYVADDVNYRKLGIYIFEVFFLIMTLQLYVDYVSIQNVIVILIIFAISLLLLQLVLDLYGIVGGVATYISKRR